MFQATFTDPPSTFHPSQHFTPSSPLPARERPSPGSVSSPAVGSVGPPPAPPLAPPGAAPLRGSSPHFQLTSSLFRSAFAPLTSDFSRSNSVSLFGDGGRDPTGLQRGRGSQQRPLAALTLVRHADACARERFRYILMFLRRKYDVLQNWR